VANPESAVVVASAAAAVVGGVGGGGATCAAAVAAVEPDPLGGEEREDEEDADELHATRVTALAARTPNSRNRRSNDLVTQNPNFGRIVRLLSRLARTKIRPTQLL
jgi:hypothetical protein